MCVCIRNIAPHTCSGTDISTVMTVELVIPNFLRLWGFLESKRPFTLESERGRREREICVCECVCAFVCVCENV